MTADDVLLIALAVFFLFTLLEVPIGLSLIVAGSLGIVLLSGSDRALDVLAAVPFSSTASYSLFAIPAFILLGAVVSNSGIARHMFFFASKVTRRVPNGVAVTTVGATTLMSGISGSSAADVASMGRMCVREMTKVGYNLSQSAAIVAAASAFAALIPPSIGLVLYAIIAGESVGDMLLAGIVPGLLSAGTLMTFLMIRGRAAGRRRASEAAEEPAAPVGPSVPDAKDARRGQVSGLLVAVAIFGIVLGGIYAGFLTATEAAGAGALAAIVLVGLLPRTREKKFGSILWRSLAETVTTSGMIFLLVIGGATVSYLVVTTSLPERISEAVLGLPVPPSVVLALFLVVLIPLGMFLDGLSIMLLTLPIVAPVVVELGFDPIWFGILFMKMVEIGLITPPVGINVYVAAGMFKGLSVESVFKSVFPFVLLDLCVVVFLFFTPDVVTWLPSQAG